MVGGGRLQALLHKAVNDLVIGRAQQAAGVLRYVVNLVALDGSLRLADIVAYEAQAHEGIKAGGHVYRGGIVPKAIAGLGQALPRKVAAGVHFAAGGYISMAHKMLALDTEGFFEVAQQLQQGGYLRLAEGLAAIVVYFYTQAAAVEVGGAAPAAGAGMVAPQVVVQHVYYLAIAAHYVVRTHSRAGRGKGADGLPGAVLGSVVQHYQAGFSQAEIGGTDKAAGKRIGQRIAADGLAKGPCLLFIHTVGSPVRRDAAGGKKSQKAEGEAKGNGGFHSRQFIENEKIKGGLSVGFYKGCRRPSKMRKKP